MLDPKHKYYGQLSSILMTTIKDREAAAYAAIANYCIPRLDPFKNPVIVDGVVRIDYGLINQIFYDLNECSVVNKELFTSVMVRHIEANARVFSNTDTLSDDATIDDVYTLKNDLSAYHKAVADNMPTYIEVYNMMTRMQPYGHVKGL